MKRAVATGLVSIFALAGCEAELNLQAGEDSSFGTTTPGESPTVEEPPPGTIERPPGEEMPDEEICRFIDPGAAPLRRLTVEEYHNSVRDLFPFVSIPDQGLSPDEKMGNFRANTVTSVNDLQAEEYLRASEDISRIVVSELDTILDSNPDETAVRAFIKIYGKRAFRRPLEETEVDAMYQLYEAGQSQFDTETGAQMVVESILQSPHFLYRVEVGEPSDEAVVELTDYEVASRLSYFLWGSLPDDALLSLADGGRLSTKEEIETQARRMLDDPRARGRINQVFEQWLQLDGLDSLDRPDPAFTDEMRRSMVGETQAFIDHVVWEDGGSIETLLTADYSFVDANTAQIYGVEVNSGEGMTRVDLPDDRRGILSQPGLLTATGHGQMPVYRGKFVRDAFFCLTTPDPPDELEMLETTEGESLRSKSEKRMNATDEGCATCHLQMDNIGLVFDHYDSLGRYQTEDEHGNPLDGSGAIFGTVSTDQQVDGVVELATALAGSEEVKACVSKQFFRYGFARMTSESDGCSLHMVREALNRSNGDVKEMLVAMTTTDAFRYRKNPTADN